MIIAEIASVGTNQSDKEFVPKKNKNNKTVTNASNPKARFRLCSGIYKPPINKAVNINTADITVCHAGII